MKDTLAKVKSTTSNETVYLGFDPRTDAAKEQFAGVESVSAGIHRGRVIDFNIDYVGPTWTTVDEWIMKLSETLKLPAVQDWVVGPDETPNKLLKCDGIEIEAALQGGSGSIRI